MSFTKAADQLGITQSAISHGVRELERRLGTLLFERSGRQLQLSESGRRYLPYAIEALDSLKAGDAAITPPEAGSRILTISVSPSFAAKWLVPRLGAFFASHPDIDLRISATPQHVDLTTGEVDLAVRHGDGNWPSLHCTQLCAESLFPVCNPLMLDATGRLTIGQLGKRVLIHHRDHSAWTGWFQAFAASPPPNLHHGPIYNEMSLAIDAAVAGQGVALARTALAALDLAAGRLVRPVAEASAASFSYWIVCAPDVAGRPRVERFRNWLLSEAGRATEETRILQR